MVLVGAVSILLTTGSACRMEPMLKDVAWERSGDELRIVFDVREQLAVDDPDGLMERLLVLLREGGRSIPMIAEVLGRPCDEIGSIIEALDEYRLVENGLQLAGLSLDEQRRHVSNLAFFECFATLATSRESFYRSVREGHVLVLGTGGLNANVIPSLCGLGVGRLTLLDRDRVEAGNFARQFLYRWEDIGSPKVARAAAWVHAFDPTIEVEAIEGTIADTSSVKNLLAAHRPNIVMSGVDTPGEIDLWVNEACVSAGIPYVRGGLWDTQGRVWSVMPGRSACRECVTIDPDSPRVELDAETVDALTASRLHTKKGRVNRAIGPIAAILGALAAFEVLRYLTWFEAPAYAGRPVYLDFAAGCAMSSADWIRRPDCRVCGSASPTGVNAAGGVETERLTREEVTQ